MESKFLLSYGVFITRKEFPICLTYAITIHKSQGLTVESCVVDVGDSVFSNGQTYVAMSRVKSMAELHLITLNPMSVKANNGAIVEYNCLRSIYRKDLLPLEILQSNNRRIPDKNKYSRKQIEATMKI